MWNFQDLASSLKRRDLQMSFLLFAGALFSYPLMRSPIEAIFLQINGAKRSPVVWLLSIIGLSLAITFYNKLQPKWGVLKLYGLTCKVTILGFAILLFGFSSGFSWMTYPLYVFKEIYIILLIHMSLAFFNSAIDMKEAKVMYGLLGAFGSIGGIIGASLVATYGKQLSPITLICMGLVPILICLLATQFYQRKHDVMAEMSQMNKTKALSSLKCIRLYTFLLIALVVISQFVINAISLKFNFALSEVFQTSGEKTQFFGRTYQIIHIVTLSVQLLLVPFLFHQFKVRALQFIFPIIYLMVFLAGTFSFGAGPLLFWNSVMFITVKGLDYSLFAGAKELLYFSCSFQQKFGLKYLVDMIFYRAGKGMVSFILIFYQSESFISALLYLCLGLWFIICIALFKENKRLERRAA